MTVTLECSAAIRVVAAVWQRPLGLLVVQLSASQLLSVPAVPAPVDRSWASRFPFSWLLLCRIVLPPEEVSARKPSFRDEDTMLFRTVLALAVTPTEPTPK